MQQDLISHSVLPNYEEILSVTQNLQVHQFSSKTSEKSFDLNSILMEDNFSLDYQDDQFSAAEMTKPMKSSRKFDFAIDTPGRASEIKFMSANRFLSRANQFISTARKKREILNMRNIDLRDRDKLSAQQGLDPSLWSIKKQRNLKKILPKAPQTDASLDPA